MVRERKQLNWRWVWLGAALILVLVFMSVRSLTRDRLEVRVAQAAHRSLESTISTNGRVEPITPYEIAAPISTTVKAVYVQPGDVVPAGKLLLTLDDMVARAKLATAESGVKSAEAAYEAATHNGTREQQQATAAELSRARIDQSQAQGDLDALTKLSTTGAASASEVAAAKQRLESANAAVEAASEVSSQGRYSPADIARANAALDDARANLAATQRVEEQTKVYAPAAGTVYTLDAKPTQFVQEGKLLVELADLHDVRVRAYFDEPEIGGLSVGQPIQIKWDARPTRIWHGHIERVPITVIHLETRTVGEVLVKVDDLEDGELLPDTNVTVTVTTASQANALSIPREALHMENGRPYVFRIAGDELKRTQVVTGAINLTQVAILSGLNEGDWIATGTISGQPLQEGVPIKEIR
jgi:HlyD family secretion protein